MAVTSLRVIKGRKFKRTDSPEFGGTRVLRVTCSDRVNDDADVAGDACPQIGAPWNLTTFTGLRVVSVDLDEGEWTADGGVLYTATVEYSTKTTDPNKQQPDPTDREGTLRLNYESNEEAIYQGLDSKPTAEEADGGNVTIGAGWLWNSAICNSNGEPFPDGLREVFPDAVYTFEKNLETNDWVSLSDKLDQFVNRVSSQDFSITYRGVQKQFNAGTVWLTQASSEPGNENGVLFEKVSVTLRVRADGWLRKVLDQGLTASQAHDTHLGRFIPIRDNNGDPVTRPHLLDGLGSEVGSPMAGTKPVFLKFRTKETADLSKLPFPEFGPGLGVPLFPDG